MYSHNTERVVSGATYIASASAVILGFSLNEWAAIVGIFVAVATLFINIWFKWQHLKIVKKKLFIIESDMSDMKEIDNGD